MLYDFHTHTFLSDGCLSPLELIRRAVVAGYKAIAITDHVGQGSLPRVIQETSQDCALARSHWDIIAIPGVELTHIPPAALAETACQAKELGASLVIVHGETPTEPVIKGTNLAAVRCPFVDILAHPGYITSEEATIASKNGVFIEITTRKGHCIANNHVGKIAREVDARLLLNSDAHDPEDLLNYDLLASTVRASNLDASTFFTSLEDNASCLIEKTQASLGS